VDARAFVEQPSHTVVSAIDKRYILKLMFLHVHSRIDCLCCSRQLSDLKYPHVMLEILLVVSVC